MATKKRRIQVVVSEAVYQEVQQLQKRLDTSASAAMGMVIVTGLAQLQQLGLVRSVEDSTSVPSSSQRKGQKQVDPKEDVLPLGFRTKGEYEHDYEHQHEQLPVVVRREERTSYMSGL